MTFLEATKYLQGNIRQVQDFTQIGDKNYQTDLVLIASNEVKAREQEIRIKQEDKLVSDEQILSDLGRLEDDLNVFYVGKSGGDFIHRTLESYLTSVASR